jgi:hypothetical protein
MLGKLASFYLIMPPGVMVTGTVAVDDPTVLERYMFWGKLPLL